MRGSEHARRRADRHNTRPVEACGQSSPEILARPASFLARNAVKTLAKPGILPHPHRRHLGETTVDKYLRARSNIACTPQKFLRGAEVRYPPQLLDETIRHREPVDDHHLRWGSLLEPEQIVQGVLGETIFFEGFDYHRPLHGGKEYIQYTERGEQNNERMLPPQRRLECDRPPHLARDRGVHIAAEASDKGGQICRFVPIAIDVEHGTFGFYDDGDLFVMQMQRLI